MDWQPVGTWVTGSSYVYTPVVTGQLFKFKHNSNSTLYKNLKVVIKQSFDDNGVTTFFDSKVLNCKLEQDVILFSVPKGITNRRLGIVRVDSLVNEQWNIEIESLEVLQDGVILPINISDVIELQSRLDEIQVKLLEKAIELELHSHIINTNNPHQVTISQIGAEVQGTAVQAMVTHESTTNHPLVTTSVKGMMSSADKTKLDGIALRATANQTNAFLLDRSKHQGTQPIVSIEGLGTVLNSYITNYNNEEVGGIKTFTSFGLFKDGLQVQKRLTSNAHYYNDAPLSIELQRTVTTQEHICTDIGYFNLPNGGMCFRVSLVVSDSNFSLAKIYAVVTCYSAVDTGWLRLVPLKEQFFIAQNNCDIDIRINGGITSLRIHRSGGDGDNGTATVRLEFTGNSGTQFVQTSAVDYSGFVVGTY